VRIAAALAALLLPGVGLAQQADVAAKPFPADASVEQIVRASLGKTFKDPDSAQIKVTRGPRLATATTNAKAYSGWLACAQINAKNSYGAYVGYADYLVVIDPSTMTATPLPRLTRSFENVDAWRSECVLKHEDDPTAASSGAAS
jgi:hypothetical protein